MKTFLLLLVAIGLAPLAAGMALLRPAPRRPWPRLDMGSVLLCALAFSLTFFWQELWLVIPKALTPGLHPVLYHNNHGWTGDAPDVELLQGSGALATLASGLVFLAGLALARKASVTWRRLLFWMAFQGLDQSLTQLAIGTLLPGNDVGRALVYLHAGEGVRWAVLALAITGLAFAGASLARVYPGDGEPGPADRTRSFAQEMLLMAMLATLLVVPFRAPRDIVEVALVPLFVNLVGVGWLVLGVAMVQPSEAEDGGRSAIVVPALALGATLLFFQLVLRRGIAF